MITRTVKPFKVAVDNRYTKIDNDILDYLMPICKPNTFKIVLAAIRETIGKVDEDYQDGRRKVWAEMSYSYFRLKTGIGSQATVAAAIDDALTCGFLVRVERNHAFYYRLNMDFTLQIESQDQESNPAVDNDQMSDQYDFRTSGSTETVLVPVQKLYTLKEKRKNKQCHQLKLMTGEKAEKEKEVELEKMDSPKDLVANGLGENATESKEDEPKENVAPVPAPKPKHTGTAVESEAERDAKQALSDAFEKATGLTAKQVGYGKWFTGIRELHGLGVKPEEIKAAVQHMRSIHYACTHPGALKGYFLQRLSDRGASHNTPRVVDATAVKPINDHIGGFYV